MSTWLWFLTRSTGIVAAVLIVASLVWGLMFSARATGTRRPAKWWLALHGWLGGLTLGFTVSHMALAVLESKAGLRLVDALVPNSKVGWSIGWGVVAFWLLVVVTVPSYSRIRRRLPRKAWHMVHLLSVPAAVIALVHGFQAGSDATARWFTLGLAGLAGLAMYPLVLRLIGKVRVSAPRPAFARNRIHDAYLRNLR